MDVLTVAMLGIFAGSRRELSEDGFEMTWAVNVLAPFLLTSLLQNAVTGRIVNVSSISAGRELDWGNLNQVGCLPRPGTLIWVHSGWLHAEQGGA